MRIALDGKLISDFDLSHIEEIDLKTTQVTEPNLPPEEEPPIEEPPFEEPPVEEPPPAGEFKIGTGPAIGRDDNDPPPTMPNGDGPSNMERWVFDDFSGGIKWDKDRPDDPRYIWKSNMHNGIRWHAEHGQLQYWMMGIPGNYNPFSVEELHGKKWATITARKTPQEELGSTQQQPIQSGIMSTWGNTDQALGYFEAAFILPDVPGFWGAWWALRQGVWPPELDFWESVINPKDPNGNINNLHVNLHWRDVTIDPVTKKGKYKYARRSSGGWKPIPSPTTEPFKMAGAWNNKFLAFYFGKLTDPELKLLHVSRPVLTSAGYESFAVPLYFVMQSSWGGRWPGAVDYSKLPAKMRFTDYSQWRYKD